MAKGDFAGSLVAGFNVGRAIKNRKVEEEEREALRQKALEERARQVANDVESARERTLEAIDKMSEVGTEYAKSGGDINDENFAKLRQGVQAQAMSYAQIAKQLRDAAVEQNFPEEVIATLPDPVQFVENSLTQFDTAVQAAVQSRPPPVEVLPPDELVAAGFPQESIDAGLVAQRKPDGSIEVLFKPAQTGESESALEAKFRMLVESGMPEDVARQVAAGALKVSFDPVDKTMSVINIGTGETVFTNRQPPGERVPVEPVVPPGFDASQATGFSGAAKNFGNIIVDAFTTFDVPFPENQQATSALQQVQTMSVLEMQFMSDGRAAQDIREMLGEITVKPNKVTVGDQRSLSKFKQMKRMLRNNIQVKQNMLASSKIAPDTKEDLESNIANLEALESTYDDIISSFGAGDLKTEARAFGSQLAKDGKLEELRALNDALESGDQDAIRKIMGKGDGGD